MSASGVFDAVRARHSLAGVARRSGLPVGDHGDWMVPCPLPDHHDRTPSMMLHLDTGRYHCFGCEAHGDVIQWVRDIEGVRLGEAVHILDSGRPIAAALAAGARPDRATADAPRRSDRPDPSRTSRDRIIDAVESAWTYYTCPALHSQALDHLRSRRIDLSALEAEAGTPLAGHTPSRPDGLANRMRALGFADDELVDAGVMLRFPDGRTTDFFRDRLIVPVGDDRGRLVGLIGRHTGPESGRRIPKYLNMTTTAAYDKQVAIYRPSRPRLHPHDASVVVCEGTLDALAIAAQAATSRVSALYAPVSISGLSLSATQVAAVLAIHPQPPVVAGDGDPCGQTQGSLKWARAFLAAGRQCVVVPWPAGEDPASWIARHGQTGLLAVTRKGCLHSHPGEIRPRHVGEFLTQADIDRVQRTAIDRITNDLSRIFDNPGLPADPTWHTAWRLAHDLDPAAAANLAAQRAAVEPQALLERWNRERATGLRTVFDQLAANLASLRSESARQHYTRAAAHLIAPFVVDVLLTGARGEHTPAERLLGHVAHWGARLGGAGSARYSHAAAGALSAAGIGDPFVLERQIQAAIQARIDNPTDRATCFHHRRDLALKPTC